MALHNSLGTSHSGSSLVINSVRLCTLDILLQQVDLQRARSTRYYARWPQLQLLESLQRVARTSSASEVPSPSTR